MTIGLTLTIIFLALQYGVHAIDWPLWQLFLPVMIEVGAYVLFGVLAVLGSIAGAIFVGRR